MAIYEKSIAVNQELITLLDNLLTKAEWNESLFLKATGKQVQELRDKAQQLLVDALGSAARIKDSEITKPGYNKVYISVYQAEGTNLVQWHRTIKSLMNCSVGRPVYRSEEHVKTMLRAKADKQREGCIVIYVKDEDILSTAREVTDRFGNELLSLKMGAAKPENIIEFIHCEKSYYFGDDELIVKH